MPNEPAAQIRYELIVDDLIAFNLFYFRTSPTIRATQRRNTLLALPIVFIMTLTLGMMVMMVLHGRDYWLPPLMALLSTGITGAYYAYYFKRGYVKRCSDLVRKMYAEGANPGLIGEHVLEVDAQGITERTQYGESRSAWGSLTKIESEPGYTYLFTGAMKAITVPNNSIVEGSLPQLLEVIRIHYHPDAKLTS